MLVRTVACDVALPCADSVGVWHRFLEIVNGLPGVTVLGTVQHPFPGGGMSGLVLLGESHAAIHTWPEEGRAWCELATCGDPAALPAFTGALSVWGDLVCQRER